MRLNSAILRQTIPTDEQKKQINRNPIYLILDNVLDTYNIGSLFRLADAVSAEKIYLCGECEIPPHTRITKAAIDTDKWVAWEYRKSALEVVTELKQKGVQIVSLEQNEKSVAYDKANYKFPIAVVCGNETYGVSQEVLDASDIIAEIPMHGINVSLNVVVSSGILVYEIIKNSTNNDRLQLQTQIYQVPMAEIVRKTLDKNLPSQQKGNAQSLLNLAKLKFRGGDKNLSKNYKKYLFDDKYAKKSSR